MAHMQNRDKPAIKIAAPVKPAVSVQLAEGQKRNVQELIANVSANRSEVVFPSDIWGITRELRKAGLDAAAHVRGNEVKLKLLLETMAVILAHAKKRFPEDQKKMAAIQATQAKYAEAREPMERWSAPKVQEGTK